jgi:hypothetical protein
MAVTAPKFPLPAAHRPEEVGLVLPVDSQRPAVGGDQLDGQMVLQASPCLRTIQLKPPPSMYPATPTSDEVPAR